MKTLHIKLLAILTATLLPLAGFAAVNSGSDGHDGAFNPTQNVTIDMADHPDGIYHYTSVNIPAGVTVSFIPNAGNKPVVWLVQGTCVINGTVDVSGQTGQWGTQSGAGLGGPGGFTGGHGGNTPASGQGPGGGGAAQDGSYGTLARGFYYSIGNYLLGTKTYGNSFILPLFGGSGGGGADGSTYGGGGGGGGGAILIAASTEIRVNGSIAANGGSANATVGWGSGGGVRLVSTKISGDGSVNAWGGGRTLYSAESRWAGDGRIRFDTYDNSFAGTSNPISSQGFQPIILPASGQGIQLNIASVAGAAIPASPSGVLANPDVIIPAQQNNPIPIVVNCSNIPLNTEITVVVHPANGADVQAVGINSAGTLASSTATVSLNMPRGGGIIYAKAVTGIGGTASATSPTDSKTRSLAETGWTADGERFAKMEITATLGGHQQIAYITESGKRYPLAAR